MLRCVQTIFQNDEADPLPVLDNVKQKLIIIKI